MKLRGINRNPDEVIQAANLPDFVVDALAPIARSTFPMTHKIALAAMCLGYIIGKRSATTTDKQARAAHRAAFGE